MKIDANDNPATLTGKGLWSLTRVRLDCVRDAMRRAMDGLPSPFAMTRENEEFYLLNQIELARDMLDRAELAVKAYCERRRADPIKPEDEAPLFPQGIKLTDSRR